MTNSKINREQLSLSQYEESRAKEAKKKLFPNFPLPVLFLFLIPIIILLITFLSYIFYIKSISSH
jgi:ABC-type multidrug transport system permease subunit